ncbi:MAG TPA: pitrilysin family protein [Dermatophilaceae bacterium]|nr:pitrilysin family protein [Dermatophilaceae bacterium]
MNDRTGTTGTTGTTRPPVLPPPAWALPEPVRQRLPGGVELVGYDVPGQYVLSLRLVLPVPLGLEPRALEGIATIMARSMDEGTQRHEAEQLAELLERKGVAFGVNVGEAGITVEVEVAKRRLGEAVALLAEIVREPVFPDQEVDRQVRTRLAEIDREHAAPGQRAALQFLPTYFAAPERASRPTGGAAGTVAAITAGDVRTFHREVLGPVGATLVVAGDLAGLDVAAPAAAALADWPDQPRPPLAAGSASTDRAADADRVVFVDRPGSVQTEFYIGCPGPDRRHPSWAAYPLLSFVVGGSPTSRVDAVLREEKGYTYGIRSGFRPRPRGGLFLTTGSVRADATVESLALLLGILDRDGFTEEEVRGGADFIAMTAPARFATADALADEAATLALDGMSTEFTSANLARVGTLTPQEVTTCYREFVDGRWTVVLVGDASRYADGVRALGRGEVSVVPA